MSIQRIIRIPMFAALIAMGAVACTIDVEPTDGEFYDENVSATESELKAPADTRYFCKCVLDMTHCENEPDGYTYVVVKKDSCRYKKPKDICLGECIGRCAQQGGGIQTGSEFNGICEKKKVTPGGIFTIAEGCTPDDTTEF